MVSSIVGKVSNLILANPLKSLVYGLGTLGASIGAKTAAAALSSMQSCASHIRLQGSEKFLGNFLFDVEIPSILGLGEPRYQLLTPCQVIPTDCSSIFPYSENKMAFAFFVTALGVGFLFLKYLYPNSESVRTENTAHRNERVPTAPSSERGKSSPTKQSDSPEFKQPASSTAPKLAPLPTQSFASLFYSASAVELPASPEVLYKAHAGGESKASFPLPSAEASSTEPLRKPTIDPGAVVIKPVGPQVISQNIDPRIQKYWIEIERFEKTSFTREGLEGLRTNLINERRKMSGVGNPVSKEINDLFAPLMKKLNELEDVIDGREEASLSGSFTYGTENQYNIHNCDELRAEERGLPLGEIGFEDKASCSFTDYCLAELFLKDPDSIFQRPQEIIHIALIEGLKAKRKFKVDKNIKSQNYNPFHEDLRPYFASKIQINDPENVYGYSLGVSQTFLPFIREIEASAKRNQGLAFSTITRGPASFGIAIDFRDQKSPKYYLFDSHGKKSQADGVGMAAYMYTTASAEDLSKCLQCKRIQPKIDVDYSSGLQEDAANTFDPVIITKKQ